MLEHHTAELELTIDGDEAFAANVLNQHDVTINRPKPTRFIVEQFSD
jgi:hypothetical protein